MKMALLLFLVAAPLAAETTIKGGRMELLNKGESVMFSEGVKLDHGIDQLKAQRMKTNKGRDKVNAWGDVKLFRRVSSTETWQGFGDSGFYDTKNGTGYLEGNKKDKAIVIHTEIIDSTTSRVVTVRADRIDFFRESKRAFAKGAVTGDTIDPDSKGRYDFWADQAEFDGENKRITLSGTVQPIVIETTPEGKRTVTGDKIVYETESKRVTSEGKAQAVFLDNGTKKKEAGKKKK